MLYFFRIIRIAVMLLLMNWTLLPLVILDGWVFGALVAAFIFINIYPRRAREARLRLRVMIGGYELLLCAFFSVLLEIPLFFAGFSYVSSTQEYLNRADLGPTVVYALITLLIVAGIAMLNGLFRVVFTSKSLRIVWRIMLLTLWWVPFFNIFLFVEVLRKVRGEYDFAVNHEAVMEVHAENSDCATKHPILMVHGIFFRDWQLVNYWGRIPRELTRCGAKIYYGGQQSAAPIEESAAELRESILRVIEETGCEKVNIIAHSKGGLDSRYAISKLGMSEHVASLTTINTPHRGCVWARTILEKYPESVLRFIDRRYNKLFQRLGDKNPDFLGGVGDLSDISARRFNSEVLDSPRVFYQSSMSLMSRARSSPFPLNVCWRLVTKYDREPNDGLVPRSSAIWGDYLGEISVKGRRGVSHGDMIDLFREDITGFDAIDFYAGLIRGLKKKGF